MLPVLRDYDSRIYIREWSGGLMAGGFEPVAKPCFYETGVPENFEFQLLEEDWDHFGKTFIFLPSISFFSAPKLCSIPCVNDMW